MASNFFAPGFDQKTEEQNIERSRQYAELMRQQSQQPLQGGMAGRVYVPPHWTAGLAQMIQSYKGGQGVRQADERQTALANAVRGRQTEEMGKFTRMLGGAPAQPTGQSYQTGANEMGDEAAQVPQWQGAQAPNPRAAYAQAMQSADPAMQKFGLQGLGQLPQLEAAQAERADSRTFRTQEAALSREARATELQETRESRAAESAAARQARADQLTQQHELRMTEMAAQNASRSDMVRTQQEFQREMKKLAASSGGGQQPYFQPLQTANGVMAFNARTGRIEPVMGADGKPVVGAASDPALQGNIAGAKAGASTTGKAQAEARMDAPKAIAQADEAIKLIDDLLTAPGFKQAVGGSRMVGIQKIPGTSAKDFDIRLDQLKGKQFLEAFESLKGGGAITEVEGKKATDAIARMDAAGTEQEFIKASREFQAVIRLGAERARAKGGTPAQPAPTGAPANASPGMPSGFRVIR